MSRKSFASIAIAVSLVGLTGCTVPNLTTPGTTPKPNGTTTASGAGFGNKPGELTFEGGSGKSSDRGMARGGMMSPTMSKGAPASAPMADAAPAGGLISNNAGGLISNEAGGLIADHVDSGATVAAPVQQQTEALKAGAIDDNAKFADWLAYLKNYDGPKMRPLDVSERKIIKVVDADGHAVNNAVVTVSAGDKVVFTGKSYADGELLFHPKAATGTEQITKFQVKAAKGELTKDGTFERNAEGAWELKLGQAAPKAGAKLDVLFLIDATGSMGGEISRLQDTIKTVAGRLKGLEAQPSVRYGLVAYRDQGEEYVTASADFTSDIDSFKASLDQVEAAGGGDKPEDVESGLAKAVNGASWGDDSVRLVFLVADAAPHVDYEQSTPYTTSMKKAAEKGIKLFPIGCSGLEPEGEYAFRQMAQFTLGQYLFITRGGDERTEGAASATVDKFQEGRLDDIVVDIVKAELAGLGK
jgi:Mg-chelatase subunit ChlD